jgi:hypothetical protein
MVMVKNSSDTLPAEARTQPRSSMFLAAVLRAGTEQAPVKVRNMSANGAMIETSVAPAPGSKVDLMRGALIARGTIIWTSANKCGVRFSSEVAVKDWLAAPDKVQQKRVDEMIALVKGGSANPRLDEGPNQSPRSHEQLVDDLGAIVSLMQDLEDDLAASDATLERHGMKLQNLDIAMQMLRAVAGELVPDDSDRPVSIARLEDLRIACAQALGTA